MDTASYAKWDEYTQARDDMLVQTSSEWAPWHTVRSDDKFAARLNVISDILARVPYIAKEHHGIQLPDRVVTADRAPEIVEKLLVEDRFGTSAVEKD